MPYKSKADHAALMKRKRAADPAYAKREAQAREARRPKDSAFVDSEMRRNQERHHRDALIKRVNFAPIDGEANDRAVYDLIQVVTQHDDYILHTSDTPLTFNGVTRWQRQIQFKEIRHGHRFNDTIFAGFYYGYDKDKQVSADSDYSHDEKIALFQQAKRAYGRVVSPDWREGLESPSLGATVRMSKKKISVDWWKRDENGDYMRDEDGCPVLSHASTVTWDTASLANQSFIKVCEDMLPGMPLDDRIIYEPLLDLIREGKSARGTWEGFNSERRVAYNRAELKWLLYWLEGLRAACIALELSPHTLNSPAALTRAGFTKYAVKRHIQPEWYASNEFLESDMMQFIRRAQFAGRIEQIVQQFLDGIHEYDINSAYPSHTRKLPCCAHGHFRWLTQNELYSAQQGQLIDWTAYEVRFRTPSHLPWGPLAVRRPDNSTAFPSRGQGVYWNPEIASAQRAGVQLEFVAGLQWVPECDEEHPFELMVADLFAMRIRFKNNPAAALVVKLALNSMYGTLCQRNGERRVEHEDGTHHYSIPKTQNLFAAGWITSATRAQLYDAIQLDPWNVVGVSTDAIQTLRPHPFPPEMTPDEKILGLWAYENAKKPVIPVGMIMPGMRIYRDPKRSKYRGFGKRPRYYSLRRAMRSDKKSYQMHEQRYVTYEMWARTPHLPQGEFVPFIKEIDLTPRVLQTKRDISRTVVREGVTYYLPYRYEPAPSVLPPNIVTEGRVKFRMTLEQYENSFLTSHVLEYQP